MKVHVAKVFNFTLMEWSVHLHLKQSCHKVIRLVAMTTEQQH